MVLGVAVLLLGARTAWAWEIQSFDADLAVQADGSVRVTETIEADFQGEPHHGIYRDIPLQTQDRLGIKQSIRLTFLGATDEDGRPWEAKLSRVGVYRRIRLGSQGALFDGRKTFKISYLVQKVLQVFPDHDELYWNATGNNWAVPILRAGATVRLPHPVPADRLRSVAYAGAYGSSSRDVLITASGGDSVRCSVNRPLNAFEGLTIVAGWPPGVTAMPTRWQKLLWFFEDNWPLGIPIGALILMTVLWWNFGRDLPRGTVTVRYDPPEGLTPAEAGTLVDDAVGMKDITASIVDLARRGFLSIEEVKGGDYILTRRPRAQAKEPELKRHEALLLYALFSGGETVRLSDLENRFYSELPDLHEAIYHELMERRYWWGRPDQVRVLWWGISAAVFAVGLFTASAFADPQIFLFSVILAAGIIALFAPFMPRKSPQGARARDGVLGLEEFLRRTDQDRLRRESDPQALFERLLPYAMVLGVANQWAKAFEGIYRVQPAWYTSYAGGYFTPVVFTRRLNDASGRMGAVMASAPRSSGGSGFGGGFSGGGFGGGGGGAW